MSDKSFLLKNMNMTTSVDSFDTFKLFSGVIHEFTSTKRYIPQTESFSACKLIG